MIIDYEDDGVIRWERNGEKKHAELIELIEAYEAEPIKHASWETADQEEPRRYACSVCKRLSWYASYYCPNCGAKMDEVEE